MTVARSIILIAVLGGAAAPASGSDYFSRSGHSVGGVVDGVPPEAIRVDIRLTVARGVWIQRKDGAEPHFYVELRSGGVIGCTPDGFAILLYEDEAGQAWWNVLLNISSPIGIVWVTLGLLGQVLFTGRMIVQWLASEKQKRSVVPPVFWWMSLIGATMLLVYFTWRKDVVGFIGQATGWGIYVRNLMLIYRPGPHAPGSGPTIADDPAPEPELSE